MRRVSRLKRSQKVLIISAVAVLVVAAFFLSTQTGGGSDALTKAVEGGELTLTSMGRNNESLTQFLNDDEEGARQLLQVARETLENARARLNSAKLTDDEYVRNMVNNFESVAEASEVMANGTNNLLDVSANLTNAISYYSQKDHEKASEQASYCLQVLAPLVSDFEASESDLKDIDRLYIASGQRDKLTNGVEQFTNEKAVYDQIILLLRSIIEGKDYLNLNKQLEESMRQLQSAVANKDYEKAEELRQSISQLLQTLRNQEYQNAADLASQLDPSVLSGSPAEISQELRDRLRNLEGLDSFDNFLQSLQKYLEALELLKQGDAQAQAMAEQAVREGLSILGQGKANDPELQGLYDGLREAFNTLEQRIRGQPDQG